MVTFPPFMGGPLVDAIVRVVADFTDVVKQSKEDDNVAEFPIKIQL